MNEPNSRSRLKEKSMDKLIKHPIGEWNTGIKIVILIIIGWLLFKFKMLVFLTVFKLIFLIIEGLGNLGFIEHGELYRLSNQIYYFHENALINLMINYGVVFSIIGFIDKFFPELYKIVFQYLGRLRDIIPTFPFSGLIRFTLLILELLFKVTWIFSSSVIRFVTSLFSFTFVLLYKKSLPLFSSLFKSLDYFNERLGSASNRIDSNSRKIEK